MESKGSLRFIYMDDEGLLSPTSSLHDNLSIESGCYCRNDFHHYPDLSPPLCLPPISTEAIQHGREFNRNRNHHHNDNTSSHDHDERTGRRKSIRKSISHVLTSPVRAVKGKISLKSPPKATNMGLKNNHHKEWRKELGLPRDVVTQDEAIAFLLAKELNMLDF
jgi:hypothetical protein